MSMIIIECYRHNVNYMLMKIIECYRHNVNYMFSVPCVFVHSKSPGSLLPVLSCV